MGSPFSLSAQVRIEGDMIQVVTLKPGAATIFRIGVRNENTEPTDISIILSDYTTSVEGDMFLMPGSTPSSLMPWIKPLPAPRFSLEGKRRGVIEFPVAVPAGTAPCSKNILVLVRPEPREPVMAVKVGTQIITQYGIQLIVNVAGGAAALKVLGSRSDGEDFFIDVMNSGVSYGEWWITSPISTEVRAVRLYPGCARRLKFPLSQLSEGQHSIRVLFDDRQHQLLPFFFDVTRKRPVPLPVPLSAQALAARHEANSLRAHLNLSLATGNYRKQAYVNGSLSFQRVTLAASSQTYFFNGDIVQGQNLSASYRPAQWLTFTAQQSWWGGFRSSAYGVQLHGRSTGFYVSFNPEFGYITGSLNQLIFKRYRLNVSCYASQMSHRREWNVGIDVPIF